MTELMNSAEPLQPSEQPNKSEMKYDDFFLEFKLPTSTTQNLDFNFDEADFEFDPPKNDPFSSGFSNFTENDFDDEII
jgi:hypothetical protein